MYGIFTRDGNLLIDGGFATEGAALESVLSSGWSLDVYTARESELGPVGRVLARRSAIGMGEYSETPWGETGSAF